MSIDRIRMGQSFNKAVDIICASGIFSRYANQYNDVAPEDTVLNIVGSSDFRDTLVVVAKTLYDISGLLYGPEAPAKEEVKQEVKNDNIYPCPKCGLKIPKAWRGHYSCGWVKDARDK